MVPTKREEELEAAHWRGTIDERITAGDRLFVSTADAIDRIEETQVRMQVEFGELKTRVMGWSAIGGMIGSVVVGLIVVFVGRGF